MPKGIKLGGRKKGAPNKLTGDVQEMGLAALDKSGGADYLYKQSLENINFITLVSKVLPLTVASDPNVPVNPVRPIILLIHYGDAAASAASPSH